MTAYKKTMREALQEVSSFKVKEEEKENQSFIGPEPLPDFDDEGEEVNTTPHEVELDEAKIAKKVPAKDGGYFVVLHRDTKGMRGTQDKFLMRILNKGKVKELGSHPSLDGALKFAKNQGIIEEVELDEKNKLKEELGEQIVDKYLNTKQGSLEESVLEIWKEAAIEEDFRMDGRTKAYKEHRARLESARKARLEKLTPKQKQLDIDGDGEIEASDLAKLRKGAKPKKEGLENSPNAANSQHLCAKNVVHEEWGNGECVPTMHAEPDEEGNIGWYDVMFEHGLEKGVAINELKVTHSEMHHNHKKKKNDEEVEEVEESYEMGTDEYRKHTQSITPGQDVTDFQNFKVESMREALAKVWEKAGLEEKVEYVEYKFKNKNDAAKAKAMLDAVQLMSFDINDDDITNGELVVDAGNKDMTKYHKQIMQKFSPKVLTQENELEEYITKDGMRRRVAEGDKRRTENKDTGKGGKTMTGKTSDVINLKPSTDSK